MAEVIVYSGDHCPYCQRAKMLLNKKGAAFTEIDVSANPEKRIEMMEKAAGRKSIPQIFINGAHIGGCDDLYALDTAGKLDSLLAQ